MYYTRYPEMIMLNRNKKIAILAAGLRTNIVMTLIALAVMGLSGVPSRIIDACGIIVLVNFHFIVINISPFLMNDGYYILMNVLGISGLRTKMWELAKGFVRKSKEKIKIKHRFLFLPYMFVSLAIMGINLFITITWISKVIMEIVMIL